MRVAMVVSRSSSDWRCESLDVTTWAAAGLSQRFGAPASSESIAMSARMRGTSDTSSIEA